jgi:hypothetical protein
MVTDFTLLMLLCFWLETLQSSAIRKGVTNDVCKIETTNGKPSKHYGPVISYGAVLYRLFHPILSIIWHNQVSYAITKNSSTCLEDRNPDKFRQIPLQKFYHPCLRLTIGYSL